MKYDRSLPKKVLTNFNMRHLKAFIFIGIFTLFNNSAIFAQQTGGLKGQVVDSLGAVVVGATVTAVDTKGKEKSVTTDRQGEFNLSNLAPGNYTVRVVAPNFGLYENTEVEISAGKREDLIVALSVESIEEQVQVTNDNKVSTDADNNLSATVLKEADLDALPDDPDELEAALQALAGPSAGPNGGQIYIDGFTGGQLPPKESIREIRINQNPFSAEFDRLGFGRIEILTKPGSDKFRGQAFFNFNDESLNSRNPFAVNRAASQTRFFGGSVSGPVKKGKSSFFIDASNRQIDNGALVNAQIIDPGFNIVSLNQEFTVPTRRFQITPRFDYQINNNNTLVARYSFSRDTFDNQGIGDSFGISLPSRAYQTSSREHEFRLTETMIINAKTVNETRFEYSNDRREQNGDNSIPTISVPSAFTGGGAQIGLSFNSDSGIEFQNYTTTSFGKRSEHAVKFGVRVRNSSVEDRSESNYGGTFQFSGFFAANDPFDLNGDGLVSPIEQYRAKVSGATDARYNPNQFRITAGNPVAKVSQTDVGLFITDDWRVNPSLTLSGGLRYEYQTNVSDNFNFAPRLAFAYSPGAGGARAPKTVFRGGVGIFYDRISDNLTLNINRFDGVQQLSYVVSNNNPQGIAILSQPVFTLNGVSNLPAISQLSPLTNTIRRFSPDLQSPYTIQTVFSVDRQLPARITLSVSYIGARTIHQLRSRNINAPVCPTFTNCNLAPRPDPTQGPIYEYESNGYVNQQSLNINFRSFLNSNFTLFGNYRLGTTKSDSDGAGSFPSYSYDLNGEYGNASSDIRHFFIIGGSFGVPWGIRLSPFVIARSGTPFNITSGIDSNADSLFNERPTFGQLADRCNEIGLNDSFCDVSGVSDLNQIIPRNYGRGPSSFTVNLRLNKTFGFGKSPDAPRTAGNQGGQGDGGTPGAGGGRGGGGGGGGPRGGGGFGGFGGGGDTRKPYNLNLGLNINNLFNTVNLANPIGNLNSSRFGQSVATSGGFGGFRGGGGGGNDSGNRRVELQMRFSF